MPSKSLPDIVKDPFGERARRAFRGCYAVLGVRCHVEANDARLLRLAAQAYGGLPEHRFGRRMPDIHVRLLTVADPPASRTRAGRQRPSYALVSGAGLLGAVSPHAGCMALSLADRAALITVGEGQLRHAHDVRYDLLECAVYTLAARAQGLVPLHAACLARDGKGVLIMGASGAGKSTLAWNAARAGWEFVAEDSVFVEPEHLRASGVANFVHLRTDSPDAATVRRDAVLIQRRSGVRKYEVDLRRLPVRLAPRPVTLVGTVFLSARAAGRRSPTVRLPREHAARRLADEQPYAIAQSGWRRFTGALLRRPSFELRRGDCAGGSVVALDALLETM